MMDKVRNIESKTKNLFDYATKELSQDAFLRWLFENYKCDNESVRSTCRRIFESFTTRENGEHFLDFSKIEDVHTEAQWKHIDISIWFKIDGEEFLIVIEDKIGSEENNQLENYNNKIEKHNTSWINNKGKNQSERFVQNRDNIFKIFYKTNIIDNAERDRVKKQNWKIYDIEIINSLFVDIKPTNDVLRYYIDYIEKISGYVKRNYQPSTWHLLSWHSFFNGYVHKDCISEKKQINCFQKQYYYMKLFVKEKERVLPCLEIRSKDFKKYTDGKCSLRILAVLYDLEKAATEDTIRYWQSLLQRYGFSLSNRKEKHKQIAYIITNSFYDTEEALKKAIDDISELLISIFKDL